MPELLDNSKDQNPPITLPPFAGFLQYDVHQGEVPDNWDTVTRLLGELAPPAGTVIALPELWATGFAYDQLPELADRTPELLNGLKEEANRFRIYLAGSLPEIDQQSRCFYNTLFVTGPNGVLGRYRKQRLFASMAEDRYFTPGDNPCATATPQGHLATLVCFDLRFPELTRIQAAQGAGLLVVSAQWPAARTHHWRALLQARAIENQIFVLACNRSGITGETRFGGHSMLIDPNGTLLLEAGEGEEIGIAPLDTDVLENLRDNFNTVGPSPYPFADQEKISPLPELVVLVTQQKKAGKRIVFTNGCFDILHPGHVTYLEKARRMGDCLIVGLNNDASVKALNKGNDRPINQEADRARLLAALGCVDHVVLFKEDTPLNLIKALMPDILVKGGDWPVEKIVGAAEVEAAGGKVLSIPLVGDHSTSNLLDRIKASAP